VTANADEGTLTLMVWALVAVLVVLAAWGLLVMVRSFMDGVRRVQAAKAKFDEQQYAIRALAPDEALVRAERVIREEALSQAWSVPVPPGIESQP
jgi:hypothetical protein